MPQRLTLVLVLCAWILPASAQESPEPPCATPEARQFDFWIGEWTIHNRHRNPQTPTDPTWFDTGTATDRVYAILDGCAIVEHWTGRLSFATINGFSVRAYDPERGVWVLVLYWPGPTGGAFGVLEGSFRHGRGEFFNTFTNADGQTVDNRFSFSDISPTAFRWDSATSSDGRITWQPGWIMEFTRRDSLRDTPLFNGPATTSTWCTAPEHRAFDFFAGTWTGTQDETSISVTSYPILSGCAMMDFVEIGDAPQPYKQFRIRAYQPTTGRWVQYAIDNRRPIFEGSDGQIENGTATLVSVDADGTPAVRETWTPGTDGTVLWKRESSADGGASWTVMAQVQLTKLP